MKNTHFYSMKGADMPDILAYLNKFAENENGKIVHWQIVPVNLEGSFFSLQATYTCVVEFEKFEMVSMHPST